MSPILCYNNSKTDINQYLLHNDMKKLKQIIAVICVVILAGMYVTTFIMAILDNSATMYMFRGCIACTIFVPVAAYLYICLHRYAMKRSKRRDYHSSGSSSDGSAASDAGQEQQQ